MVDWLWIKQFIQRKFMGIAKHNGWKTNWLMMGEPGVRGELTHRQFMVGS